MNSSSTSYPEQTLFSHPSNAIFSIVSWAIMMVFGIPLTYTFVLYEKYGQDLQRTVMNQIHSFGLQGMIVLFLLNFTPRAFLPLWGPYSETTCSLLTLGTLFFNVSGGVVVSSYTFVKCLFTCHYKRVGVLDEDFVGVFVKVFSIVLATYVVIITHLSYGAYDTWFAICAQRSLAEIERLPKVYRGNVRVELYNAMAVNSLIGFLTYRITKVKRRLNRQVETAMTTSKYLPPKRSFPNIVKFGFFILSLAVTTLSGGPAIYLMLIEELPPFTQSFSLFVSFSLVSPHFVMFLVVPITGIASNAKLRDFVRKLLAEFVRF
ncbi:uncharacterized protein LOC131883784 [Tigriopus californicus]|uniref:uncharacterized protein LOC131883784 n=1 Tax=Tigriopus californicus TaxID=6832 RepID=UPI0027DA111A|nr:uncharacterized protein LOC131883784 [Tigriopus californicus]